MSKRPQQTVEFWNTEADYIESIPFAKPGKAFCNDPAVFERYCQMQKRFAYENGAHNAALRIEVVITTRGNGS